MLQVSVQMHLQSSSPFVVLVYRLTTKKVMVMWQGRWAQAHQELLWAGLFEFDELKFMQLSKEIRFQYQVEFLLFNAGFKWLGRRTNSAFLVVHLQKVMLILTRGRSNHTVYVGIQKYHRVEMFCCKSWIQMNTYILIWLCCVYVVEQLKLFN